MSKLKIGRSRRTECGDKMAVGDLGGGDKMEDLGGQVGGLGGDKLGDLGGQDGGLGGDKMGDSGEGEARS